MAYCVCVVLAVRGRSLPKGATKRDGRERARPARGRGRDHRPPSATSGSRPSTRPSAPSSGCRAGRPARPSSPAWSRNVEGIAAPQAPDRPAARPAVADARAQPRLLDDPHHRAEHAPHHLPGLRARLAVLPGPGPAVPPARQLRASSTSCGRSATTRMSSCSTSCSRCAVPRAGGIAWEYYFTFGGGRPPWVSGLAQGTGIQSIARVAKRHGPRGRGATRSPSEALGVFKTPTPEGVRVPTADGAEYALYSFAPDLHVINGFVQALVGLYDLGRIAGDADAQALYDEGERVARRELPTYDTGAWSLYSRGSSRARVRPLLPPAPARVPAAACAPAPTIPSTATPSCASRSTSSSSRSSRSPPRRCAAAREQGPVRLSKISRVGLSSRAAARSSYVAARGRASATARRRSAWPVPRKARRLRRGGDRRRPRGQRRHAPKVPLEVLKPKKRKRGR